MAPDILVICGPTASGKTALAAALAREVGGEVVSADSMQIYRGMDIGTAKPTAEEMGGVHHHMLDVADPWEDYSVARYVAQATPVVEDILARGKVPILAGGTGLYIDALVAGRSFAPLPGDGALRRALQDQWAAQPEVLRRELAEADPAAAGRIHPNDGKRIIRALEIYRATGRTITQHDAESRALPPRYRAVRLGLAFRERRDMWARIDRRVEEMRRAGLEEEVRGLLASGLSPGSTAMQAIGYKELTAALRGEGDLEAAFETVKLRSRQYAKRQLTWFRRDPSVHWLLWDKTPDFSAALLHSTEYLRSQGLQ